MQTFLPYRSFVQSAAVLDDKRLGKQRVEVLQILNTILGHSKGWRNHPATKMWAEHPETLALYGVIVCDEWIARGFRDSIRPRLLAYYPEIVVGVNSTSIIDGYIERVDGRRTILAHDFRESYVNVGPEWLLDERVYSSHRSNLLRKSRSGYAEFNWPESDDLEYHWPVR